MSLRAWVGVALSGALSLSVTAAPARAQDRAITMEATSDWVLDYAEDSCALHRHFGPLDQRVWLELRQFSPGEEIQLTFSSGSFDVLKKPPKTRFLPDGPLREHRLAVFGENAKGVEAISFPDTLRIDANGETVLTEAWRDQEKDSREKAVTAIYLEGGFKPDLVLQTGSLQQPMQAMRQCMDNLLKSWGIDSDIDRALQERPKPVDMERVTRRVLQKGFPKALISDGGSTLITFRLLIDTEGALESCIVQRPVVHQSFEETMCGIFMERAKFEPALNASGNPVKSYYLQSIRYENR